MQVAAIQYENMFQTSWGYDFSRKHSEEGGWFLVKNDGVLGAGKGSSGSKQMCFMVKSGALTINQPQGCLLAYASLIHCQSFAGTSQKQALRGSLILWGEDLNQPELSST